MDTIKLVREFHDTFEVETPDKVTIDNPDVNLLRTNLLMEELSELSSALALRDPEEVLDALCDLQYVLSGAVIQLGFSEVFNEAFNRVHHSNMSKVCPNEDVAQHTIDHYMKRDNPDRDPERWLQKSPIILPEELR